VDVVVRRATSVRISLPPPACCPVCDFFSVHASCCNTEQFMRLWPALFCVWALAALTAAHKDTHRRVRAATSMPRSPL